MPLEQSPADARTRAVAFATGLHRSIALAGAGWSAWPGGAQQLMHVLACIDDIGGRLHADSRAGDGGVTVIACVADLRIILEWSTYQSACVATARALLFSRKTRTFVARFDLLAAGDPLVAGLARSEAALIENVRARCGYMTALTARHPQLRLPPPLVDADYLARAAVKPGGRLAVIAQLKGSVRRDARS